MGGPAPFGIDEEEALEKFESLWSAFEDARVSATRYSGSLGWKSNGGRTYLVHTTNLRYEGNRQRTRSLGPRSEETERAKFEFDQGRERSGRELERVRSRLDTHGRVLKALRLGRVSALTARFLRELHDEGFGFRHLRIGGGAALAAYEARSRRRMPLADDASSLDLVPTDLFVGERHLFDAIASRKIFGPVEIDDERMVLGRGVVLRLLSVDVRDDWIRSIRRAHAGRDEIAALEWAFEVPEGIPMLAVGLDGSPAPIAALDPRAHAILSTMEARYLADRSTAGRLGTWAAAAAAVAGIVSPDPFEDAQLSLFPEIADAVGGWDPHADERVVMRP